MYFSKHFFTLIYMAFFVLLAGCNMDKREKLVNTWHMGHDEMVLDLKADGSYTANEYGRKQLGKWKLSADGNTIKFKQKADGNEKEMLIKELEETRLVLDDNGDEMIFTTNTEAAEKDAE